MGILEKQQSYTFSNYSELKIDPIDLTEYFGYSFVKEKINFREYEGDVGETLDLVKELETILPRLISMNEQTKREMLISPVIRRVIIISNGYIRIEYPIKVSNQLQGTLDYLLSIENLKELLVIEAKKDDLDYGSTQLIAQLIALDKWERSPEINEQPTLLGAITTGQVWQFIVLNRKTKYISQSIDLYLSPREVGSIIRILVQALCPTRK